MYVRVCLILHNTLRSNSSFMDGFPPSTYLFLYIVLAWPLSIGLGFGFRLCIYTGPVAQLVRARA